jgi:hypothetical protein
MLNVKSFIKLILLFFLINSSSFAAEIQYVISEEFYKNVYTIQQRGTKNIFYNPGMFFDSAVKRMDPEGKTITKCEAEQESMMIVHLFPGPSYNPVTRMYRTDLEVRIIDGSGKVSKTIVLDHGTVGDYSLPEEHMTRHFVKTIDKMLLKLSDDLQKSEDLLNGNLCFEGEAFNQLNEKHYDEQRAKPKTLQFN